ncbi:unnamed protein product [Didymodactylos carnosus]|uniref:G-protein coupled receptors family 1 profile domain-containing protein n=1 Tax=Didymodactylos carnosus TaxID=1234261 RepID=A0A814VJG1_9BILA|nr:unnamed protein product [Didymodactylos carnosus]CAF3953128.1 unnamed protein product [Didymodactylos carnosus]
MIFGNNTTTTTPLLLTVNTPGLRLLIAIVCAFLYILGYTGCLLSIITFSSKKLRRHSTGFLFLIMAFVDIFNLIASLQYVFDVIYQINVFELSIHLCRFITICNYEIYFGFSWIFVFIALDRWIKVEWPTKSQKLCTRKNFIYLCLITFILSLGQNILYTFLCFNEHCSQSNIICEIFIHVIYITFYMTIPIALILISIIRTCTITLNLKKRFQQSSSIINTSINTHRQSTISNRLSTTPIPIIISNQTSITTTTTTVSNEQYPLKSYYHHPNSLSQIHLQSRQRRRRLDNQMVMLITINVAPCISVHIITEIAYLIEKYSTIVNKSTIAKLIIILIYLSWYLISATRFYTNCLLSRIYREEFKNRLHLLKNGCKSRTVINKKSSNYQNYRHTARFYTGNDSISLNIKPQQYNSIK